MNNMNWAGAVVNTEIYDRLLSERPEESHKSKPRSSEMSSSRQRLTSPRAEYRVSPRVTLTAGQHEDTRLTAMLTLTLHSKHIHRQSNSVITNTCIHEGLLCFLSA